MTGRNLLTQTHQWMPFSWTSGKPSTVCRMKIEKLGISGNILKWVKDFLTNRQLCVLINGISSKWTEASSGVPQGSVLWPLLFILYVNDLPSEVSSF